MYDKFKNLKPIKDPKVRRKLKSLIIERSKLLKQKEEVVEKELKKKEALHNKYLPKYLSPKILRAVGFIEYTKQRGELDMPGMTRFLMEEKKLSSKEIGWVLLLLSFEAIEEILATPEVGGMIKDAIQKSRGTIH
jgi:hypothetical protein